MSEGYLVQPATYVIGSASESSTLSNTFSDNATTFGVGGMNQVVFYVEYTPAANNRHMEIQVEFGPEASDVYKVVHTQTSAGKENVDIYTYEFPLDTQSAADTSYKFRIVEPCADKICRISGRANIALVFG